MSKNNQLETLGRVSNVYPIEQAKNWGKASKVAHKTGDMGELVFLNQTLETIFRQKEAEARFYELLKSLREENKA